MGQVNASQVASPSCDDANLQLCAYNTAFEELEMSFRFDAMTLASLATMEGSESARLCAFIKKHHAHLLTAYSADFLCDVILEKKNEHYARCTSNAGTGRAYDAPLGQRAAGAYGMSTRH